MSLRLPQVRVVRFRHHSVSGFDIRVRHVSSVCRQGGVGGIFRARGTDGAACRERDMYMWRGTCGERDMHAHVERGTCMHMWREGHTCTCGVRDIHAHVE